MNTSLWKTGSGLAAARRPGMTETAKVGPPSGASHISRMTDTPTFAVRPSFLGIERGDTNAAISVAGIPYDLGTSNRPGARFGPNAIRQASRMLVDGDHPIAGRSEERRVGKECRSRWSP